MAAEQYFADEGLLTAAHLALTLGRPLLLEGEPGVGKTEIAKVLARVNERELIRLQCYEGLDAAQALYEWDHPKQLLAIRTCEAEGKPVGELYDESFLMERPLLRALRTPCVLLIDEIDRADSEFEAFLLEFLSDFQITIPELGTITAVERPIVIMTSNRTRELHDALEAAVPVPLDRVPGLVARAAHHRGEGAGAVGRRGRVAGRGGGRRARAGADQAARHRRDDRVGPGRQTAHRRGSGVADRAARGRWACW